MLNAVAEIFEALKTHINESNHKDAAIDLVHTLVDTQGVSPKEIRESTLMDDEEVREALIDYDDTIAEEDDGLDPWGDEFDDSEEEEDY